MNILNTLLTPSPPYEYLYHDRTNKRTNRPISLFVCQIIRGLFVRLSGSKQTMFVKLLVYWTPWALEQLQSFRPSHGALCARRDAESGMLSLSCLPCVPANNGYRQSTSSWTTTSNAQAKHVFGWQTHTTICQIIAPITRSMATEAL